MTLHQPWASLVAMGAKRYETRSWSTAYRGPLAIHAAKVVPQVWRPFSDPEFVRVLGTVVGVNEYGAVNIDRLPRGKIVAVCTLAQCYPCDASIRRMAGGIGEEPFGDFSEGRYAWALYGMRPLDEPVEATGRQRLWEWDESAVGCVV